VASLVLAPPAARASVITYQFAGTLTNALNGNSSVTGQFTLDNSGAGAVTAFSFTEPGGVFDTSNAMGFVTAWTPATNPNANFVGLTFVESGRPSNYLWLRFQTTLSSFDGSTFYTGPIIVPGGSTNSSMGCFDPIPSKACSTWNYASGFTSGAASPLAQPVPEPLSVTLMALGLAGVVGRSRRRNDSQVR